MLNPSTVDASLPAQPTGIERRLEAHLDHAVGPGGSHGHHAAEPEDSNGEFSEQLQYPGIFHLTFSSRRPID